MSLGVFPSLSTLPGMGYPVKITPVTSTRVLTAASGKQYRAQNWSYPIRRWSIPFNVLRTFGSYSEYQTLVAFILEQAGQYNNFLYSDPTDNSVSMQPIGTGTGNQTAFPLVRSVGGYAEPVLALNNLSSVTIAGASTSAYTLSNTYGYANDTINFNTAPNLNAAIAATFTYYFVCHFTQDDPEFENIMNSRFDAKQINFESVK